MPFVVTVILEARARRLFGACLLAVLVAVAPIAPAVSATAASGSAVTASTLLSVTAGTTGASVAVDRGAARLGPARSASAGIDLLRAGTTTIGASREATSTAGSGSQMLGGGPRAIAGLGGVTVTGGSLDTSVATDKVRSATTATLVDLNLSAGLLAAGTGQTAAVAHVSLASAEVTRTLRIGSVGVLSIRALLARLGVDPTALACAGVEVAGAELGVATSQACETLAQVTAAVASADVAMDSARAILEADLQTVQSSVAGLTIVGQPLADLAATYGIDLSGLLGLLLPGVQRDALITEITRRLDAVDAGLTGLAGATCADVASAVAGVVSAIPSLGPTLSPVAAAADVACNALELILDALLDVSVIRLDGVRVSLTARALPGAPFADGSGSIGVVGVGNRTLTTAGITSVSDALAPTVQTLSTEAGQALSALGLGAFPAPEVTLLGISESAGPGAGGAWRARAAVTGARVRIPSVPIALPAGPSLAVLGPTAGAPAAPPAASPEIVVEAAVFSGEAIFTAAGGDITGIGGGSPLPVTGLPVAEAVIAGALLLTLAATVRRILIDAR